MAKGPGGPMPKQTGTGSKNPAPGKGTAPAKPGPKDGKK